MRWPNVVCEDGYTFAPEPESSNRLLAEQLRAHPDQTVAVMVRMLNGETLQFGVDGEIRRGRIA